jgi:hypothetical protein
MATAEYPIAVNVVTGALAYDTAQFDADVAINGNQTVVGNETITGAGTVNGNLTVQDAATPTKGYRFRTNGSNLDLEAAGASIFLSVWSGAAFTGTQRNYARLESGAQLLHLLGRVLFAAAAFDATGVADLDPSTGVAAVGAKNGLANIRLCGFKATAGAPASGTWTAGDLIIDSAGAWHLCTASGTPGTWT